MRDGRTWGNTHNSHYIKRDLLRAAASLVPYYGIVKKCLMAFACASFSSPESGGRPHLHFFGEGLGNRAPSGAGGISAALDRGTRGERHSPSEKPVEAEDPHPVGNSAVASLSR